MPIPSNNPEKEESADISQTSSTTTGSDVILQTVYAVGKGKRINCVLRCLLDCGSQVSFIRKDISKKLGLESKGNSNLNIHTFSERNGRFSFSELNSANSISSDLLVEEKLSRTLESFWNIESLGVNSSDERLEDEETLRLFGNSIQR
ncbi:hypothetical protein AVEN_206431-1 [Araneus ventricosus]|uniref:Peptidase aspartic putative domain-containing protein n=1 Tax=Araneus ventricosus TaxID=182803 RepID=A0A4Y2NTK0_ARAVE|nr:hypothetical protein AVEN_206431-1 [Araneus ventricosus]